MGQSENHVAKTRRRSAEKPVLCAAQLYVQPRRQLLVSRPSRCVVHSVCSLILCAAQLCVQLKSVSSSTLCAAQLYVRLKSVCNSTLCLSAAQLSVAQATRQLLVSLQSRCVVASSSFDRINLKTYFAFLSSDIE